MSFGGKSFKREELRLKQELQNLTRQSKSEFVGLNRDEKSKLLESSSKTSLAQGSQPTKRRPAKKTSKSKRKMTKNTDAGNDDSDGEIPPPSPSIDLDSELRTITPDSDIVAKTAQEGDLQGSDGVDRKTSDLVSRSTGVPSIRSKVDLNVVMYGKGLGEENSSTVKQKEKNSTAKRRSAHSRSSNTSQRSPQPEDAFIKKPAILGSQSTAVAVQLAHRPAPKQRPSSRASHQGSVKSRASSVKYMYF